MRWYSDALGTEQVSFSWRTMPPGTGGRGSYGHRHPGQEEVYFVIAGRVTFKIDDDVFEAGPQTAVRIGGDAFRSVHNDTERGRRAAPVLDPRPGRRHRAEPRTSGRELDGASGEGDVDDEDREQRDPERRSPAARTARAAAAPSRRRRRRRGRAPPRRRRSRSRSQSVNARPKAIGIVDWKTIAPVMLPSARLSLPSRTQKKLFAFSGSSVASGARISESTSGSTPSCSATVSSSSTNRWAPPTIAPSPTRNWTAIAPLPGSRRRAVAVEQQRLDRARPPGPRRRRAACGGRRHA